MTDKTDFKFLFVEIETREKRAQMSAKDAAKNIRKNNVKL